MRFRRPAVAATLTATLAAGVLATAAQPAAAQPAGHAAAAVRAPSAASGGGRSLCAPPADTVGPIVSQVKFGRPSIDLDTGSRTQTVTATAADSSASGNPSGVAGVWTEIRGNGFAVDVRLKRVSGTPALGDWQGQFVVSKYAHPGTYSIGYLDVTDKDGNEQSYPGYGKVPEGPDALSLHPADNPTFTVTGTPATRPARKPAGTLRAFVFRPSGVNTTAAPRYVRVTAKFKRVAPRNVVVDFMSAKRPRLAQYAYLHAVLHHKPGLWTGRVRIPRWLGKQTLVPTLVAVFGNGYQPSQRYYDADDLSGLHFPTKLAVVSGVDKTKPTLRSLSFSPRAIDSTTGAQKVTVTANVADVGSGVRFVEVSGGIQHGVNGVASGLYPMAAAGVGYLSSNYFNVRLRKVSTGHWAGTTTVKQCVPSGTYKLTVELGDVAQNYRYYSTKQLAGAHIASTVKVTSEHGDVAAPYVYSAATYGADHELFLNFSEGVSDVNTSTLAIYPLSPVGSRYTTPAAVTDVTCANGTTTVDCSGSGGLVTSAKLTVPSLTPGAKYEVYANRNQVTPQLVDGNGNPMDWNYASVEVQDS